MTVAVIPSMWTAAVVVPKRSVASRMRLLLGVSGNEGAPELQALDDRRVGEHEQIEISVGDDRPLHPRRNDDQVALADLLHVVTQPEPTRAGEHLVDGGSDVTAGPGSCSGPQAM